MTVLEYRACSMVRIRMGKFMDLMQHEVILKTYNKIANLILWIVCDGDMLLVFTWS